MPTLAKIDYEREEFCRFDDYGRYSKHLTRKLHTLRKSPEKGSDVLLFAAERAWSNAMQNKTLGGKPQVTLNKLRKACKLASQLTAATANGSPAERLHVVIYEDYLQASLAQERGSFDLAILHNSRALIALQNQNSSLMESVETGLRYSIYQSGAEERSINLQKFALQQVAVGEEQDDWRVLVNEVSPTSLNEEKGEEMITSIQWASRSAHLTHPDLASSISTAVSGRSALTDASDPNDFDAILAAWTAAATTLEALLEKEEDQVLAQDLELTKAWVSYHASMDRIARDKSLVRTVSAREGVLLCDAIDKVYIRTLALPGLDSTQTRTLERERREVRGERCILLAETHGTSLENVALVNRALSYFEPGARRSEVEGLLSRVAARYTLSSKAGAPPVASRWFSGDVRAIAAFDPASLKTRAVTLKPVVFDIAWNYLSSAAAAARDGTNGAGLLESAKSAARAVADRMEVDTTGAATTQQTGADAAAETPTKKGLFGGLFGGRK